MSDRGNPPATSEAGKFVPPPPAHSSRRINRLAAALKAERYLEIGVARGRTFFGVEMGRKVGVDPAFRFDIDSHQSDSSSLFAVGSDTYFLEHVADERFDIIFLDGMHTAEQTLRDFGNSLQHAHDRTVWIIDDTVPSDEHSVMRDQAAAVQSRRKAGGDGNAWHGDVFKMVFILHDFFPTLSYCTLLTGGNPQTLVWKRPRRVFRPLFDDLGVISRLTYADLQMHLPVLNGMTEDEGIAAVIAAVSP